MIHVSANKSFYLLITVSLLIFLLIVSLLSKITPLTISHALYRCSEAIQGISISLPHAFPQLFVLLLFLIIGIGLLLLALQIYKTRMFVNKIIKNRIGTPNAVEKIASGIGISGKIIVVKGNNMSSFCFGLINPEIVLSKKLIDALTNTEIKAVLLHESYHLKNRDPLKILLSQVTISIFFFVPILKDFHKYYSLSKEISADRMVIQHQALAELKSALLKTISNGAPKISGVASFAGEGMLEERIRALTNNKSRVGLELSVLNVTVSLFVLVFAFSILHLPVHAMENDDGSHSYFIISSLEAHLLTCDKEVDTADIPFIKNELFTPIVGP